MIRILPENIVGNDGAVDAELLSSELNRAFEEMEAEASLRHEFKQLTVNVGSSLTDPFPLTIEFDFLLKPAGLFVVKAQNEDPQADPIYDGFSVDWEHGGSESEIIIRHIGGLSANSRYEVTLMGVEEP